MKYIPRTVTEIELSVPDHQILLSFNNNDDAEEFLSWWATHGIEAYQKYVDGIIEDCVCTYNCKCRG